MLDHYFAAVSLKGKILNKNSKLDKSKPNVVNLINVMDQFYDHKGDICENFYVLAYAA